MKRKFFTTLADKSIKHSVGLTFATFFVITILISVGYSTVSRTMGISAGAEYIAYRDIRITEATVYSRTAGAELTYSEHYDDKLNLGVDLMDASDEIIFKVDVTNFGSINMALADIAILNSAPGIEVELKEDLSGYHYYDTICDDEDICNGGITKEIYIGVKYANFAAAGGNTHFDLNLDFDFRKVYNVYYDEELQNTEDLPTTVVENTTFSIEFTLSDEEYFYIYMGPVVLTSGRFTYEDGVLTIPDVNGNLLIATKADDDLTDREVTGTIIGNGLTITSEGSGVYTINGSNPNTAVFVRLSDFLAMGTNSSQLMSPEMPNNKVILEKGKYYDLDISILGGTHDVKATNNLRFIFRELNSTEPYQYYGYDFVGGFFGSPNIAIRDDLGMYSIYINKGHTFDNFRFRVAVYEVEPEEEDNVDLGDPLEVISGCGLAINKYKNYVYEYWGTSTGVCYIDLDNNVIAGTAPNTESYPVSYSEGTVLKISYQVLKNYPDTTQEISFTFRNKAVASSSIPLPKLSSKNVSLSDGEIVTSEGPLNQDATIFSNYINKGIIFSGFRFRVKYEEVVE